jgi:hypothetical protein
MSLPDLATTAPAPPADFAYDAYISFCNADKAWVISDLVNPLKEAKLQILHELQIGLDEVVARERAVQQSRKTIAVLTPDWVANSWQHLESMYAAYLDPTGETSRLVPLLLKTCDRPLRIRHLIPVDFTEVEGRADAMARLLRHLGRSQQVIDQVASQSASRGLRELFELMGTADVREGLGEFHALSAVNVQQTKSMICFKCLHDIFQRAQNSFDQVYSQRKLLRPEEEESWGLLETAIFDLEPEVGKILNNIRESFPPKTFDWEGGLERAQADLEREVHDQNLKQLDNAIRRLSNLFLYEPSRVNDRLYFYASELPLVPLVKILRQISERLTKFGFEGEAATRLEIIRNGISNLERLAQRLRTFVTNHDQLQKMYNSLRTITLDVFPPPAVEEIRNLWPDLQEQLEKLLPDPGKDWLPNLNKKATALVAVLDDPVCATDTKGPVKVRRAFKEFKSTAILSFNQTDFAMLGFCKELSEVSNTLANGLTRVPHV